MNQSHQLCMMEPAECFRDLPVLQVHRSKHVNYHTHAVPEGQAMDGGF